MNNISLFIISFLLRQIMNISPFKLNIKQPVKLKRCNNGPHVQAKLRQNVDDSETILMPEIRWKS